VIEIRRDVDMKKIHKFTVIDHKKDVRVLQYPNHPLGEYMTREHREVIFERYILGTGDRSLEPLMDMIRRMSKLEGKTLAEGIRHIISFSCPPELKEEALAVLIAYARETGDYTKVDNLKPQSNLRPFLTPMEEVTGG
jgi:hypothetical protein